MSHMGAFTTELVKAHAAVLLHHAEAGHEFNASRRDPKPAGSLNLSWR